MLVPKVSNLDLGSGRKAIFRGGGGGNEKKKSINYLYFLVTQYFSLSRREKKGEMGALRSDFI